MKINQKPIYKYIVGIIMSWRNVCNRISLFSPMDYFIVETSFNHVLFGRNTGLYEVTKFYSFKDEIVIPG